METSRGDAAAAARISPWRPARASGLVNRDDGVFDNLPYELAPTKFAKKDLYDRVKGKDWPGRSLKPQSVFDSLRERFGARKAVREADASRDPAKAPYRACARSVASTPRRPAHRYRGAYGFPAGSEDAAARLFAGYASPYALFLEAIDDMLGCSLAGALVEDACPLDDRVDVAGATRCLYGPQLGYDVNCPRGVCPRATFPPSQARSASGHATVETRWSSTATPTRPSGWRWPRARTCSRRERWWRGYRGRWRSASKDGRASLP